MELVCLSYFSNQKKVLILKILYKIFHHSRLSHFYYAYLTTMENIFPEGSVVYPKVNPTLKLVVRRYVKRIYYCTIQANPTQKELVYFERELMSDPTSLRP